MIKVSNKISTGFAMLADDTMVSRAQLGSGLLSGGVRECFEWSWWRTMELLFSGSTFYLFIYDTSNFAVNTWKNGKVCTSKTNPFLRRTPVRTFDRQLRCVSAQTPARVETSAIFEKGEKTGNPNHVSYNYDVKCINAKLHTRRRFNNLWWHRSCFTLRLCDQTNCL